MANQSAQRPVKKTGGINANFIGMVFLGICMLVAGLSIGGNIKKLNKTVEEKNFAASSTFSVPDSMGVSQKKYLSERDAAVYLNISSEKVVSLIDSGEISEYIKTDTGGYSIAIEILDEWFDNESYQTKLRANAVSSPEPDGGEDPEE
ncbi:MAG: helix-turn-helix domain-containing protein [Oscillospiraceae bacterium]|nr:helix-turn-helix domain-containing protein [Oscillospiraceae bacterium]